jgi:hypothetical protein
MVDRDPGTPTWKFTQCFGDKGDVEDITEADIISTVEFDHTGNYLATGDKGGRVVLFERNETVTMPFQKCFPGSVGADFLGRKKHANTNSTPSSSHTSPSSTTSNLWRLKKKSTRSNGVAGRTHRISCFQPMTKQSSFGRCLTSP